MVRRVLKKGLDLFTRLTIQNNLAENKNSFLHSLYRLNGPKTLDSFERWIRGNLIVRNHPALLDYIRIERNIRGDFILKDLILPELAQLINRGSKVSIIKKEVNF